MTDRELDVAVAEKVMGLVPCRSLIHKSGDGMPCHAQSKSPTQGAETACYCSDIAAAWDVVQRMRDAGWQVGIQSFFGNWKALLADEHDEVKHRAIGCNPAKAICLAALLAVATESERELGQIGPEKTGEPA